MAVGDGVKVSVAVAVGGAMAVKVGRGTAVFVGTGVSVAVGVAVGVSVAVGVRVGPLLNANPACGDTARDAIRESAAKRIGRRRRAEGRREGLLNRGEMHRVHAGHHPQARESRSRLS